MKKLAGVVITALVVTTAMFAQTDDTVIVGNGTTFDAKALPSCSNSTTSKLLYNSSTNTFSCGTDQDTGGGGGSSDAIAFMYTINDTVAINAVEYTSPGELANFSTSTARFAVNDGVVLTFNRMVIYTSLTQPADGSLVCTFQIAGVDTDIAVTVAANEGSGTKTDTGSATTSGSPQTIRIACDNNSTTAVGANIIAIAVYYEVAGGAGGTPTDITVADTTDSTSFVALFESATGDLAPKTDGGLTYNASTGMLTATGLTGPLTGNASTATALAANPSACSAGQFVKDLDANGTLTCDTPAGGSGDKWSKEFIAGASQAGTPTGAFSWRTSNAPSAKAWDASDYAFGTLVFPNSGTPTVYFRVTLPGSYTTIRARVVGLTPQTTGDASIKISTVCIASSEAFTGGYASTDEIVIAADATANEKIQNTGNLTLTGCAANETLMGKLQRDPADGDDDLAGDFELMALVLDSI